MRVEALPRVPPGALQRDSARAIVVFSRTGEPAVALREHLTPAQALIRDARHDEATMALESCVPFPWMVVGEGSVPEALTAALDRFPILVLWRGPLPPGLSGIAGGFERFHELTLAVTEILRRTVFSMRLAPVQGVLMPDGRTVASPLLQALVAAYPRGFRLPARCFRAAPPLLRRHGVHADLHRDQVHGETVLR